MVQVCAVEQTPLSRLCKRYFNEPIKRVFIAFNGYSVLNLSSIREARFNEHPMFVQSRFSLDPSKVGQCSFELSTNCHNCGSFLNRYLAELSDRTQWQKYPLYS